MAKPNFGDYLKTLEAGDSEALFILPPIDYSKSTSKQDSKILDKILDFSVHFGCDEWNLSRDQACGLVNSLFGVGWSRLTVEKMFIPSYKRLFKRVKGVSPDIEIINTMKEVCRTKKYVQSPKPDPFTLADIRRIIINDSRIQGGL
jgi:hypothetical protein